MDSEAHIVEDSTRVRPTGSEVRRLCCNNKKLFAATGFRPAIPLSEGLARTIAWFREERNLAKYKGRLYNV
jgi:nucleoside-diphosphate-sugar epimerase